MASGTKLGTMYWETAIDNAGLNKGLDQSQQQIEGFGQKASGAFSALTVAAGNLLASGIEKLASGILNIGVNAVSATAQMQSMEVALEGLVARELARGEEATRTYQVTSQLNADEQQQVTDLTLKLDYMNAKLQEKKQHLWEIKNRWTDEGLAAETAAADVAKYENEIAKTAAKLEELKNKQGAVNTVTEKYWINTKNVSDVLPEAQGKAKALMDELARIAIVSPYQVTAIQDTYKMAMAFGFATDEAMDFTDGVLNMAAGVGANSDMLHRMAYNLAQVRLQGKVTKLDLRQLALAGFDLEGALRGIGKQLGVQINNYEDFNAAIADGRIKWEDFASAFASYADEQFGGASERMSRTLVGLKSTFQDLFLLTIPKVVGPALEEVTMLLGDFLDGLLKIRESGVLDRMGEGLRVMAENGVNAVRGLAALPGVIKALLDWDGKNLQEKLEILSVLPEKLKAIALAGADLITAFRDGGVAGVLGELFDMAQRWWDKSGEEWLTNAVNAALEWIWKIPGKIGDAIVTLADTAKDILATTWEALYKWWDTGGETWLATTANTVIGWIWKIPGKVKEGITTLADTAKDILATTWEALYKWWDTGGETWVVTTATTVLGYVQKIPGKLSELFLGAAMDAGSWLVYIWDQLNAWWDTGGETWATETAGKIETALTTLETTLTGTTAPAWVSKSVLWLEDVWMGIADWWTDNTGQLTDSAIKGIGDWVTKELTPALRNKDKSTWADGLGKAMSDAWTGIGDYITDNEKQISYVVGKAIGAAVAKAIEMMAEFINIPILIVGAIIAAVTGDESSDAWERLKDIGFWLINGISEGFRQAVLDSATLSKLKEIIDSFLSGIASALGIGGGETDEEGVQVANSTRGFGKSLIAGLLKSLWEGNPKVSSWRDTLVENALKSATIWVEALVQAGKDIIKGLIKGLNDKKDDVINWIKGLVGDLVQAVKDAMLMHSPSLVMAQLGEYIVLGLIQGMENVAPEAVTSMTDMMTGIMGAVTSAVQGLTALANMGDVGMAASNLASVIERIKEILPLLRDLATFYKDSQMIATAQGITKPLAEIFGGLKTIIEAAADIAKISVTDDQIARVDGVVKVLMGVIKTVIGGVSSMAAGFSKEDLVQAMMLAEAVAPVLQAFKLAVDVAQGLLSVSTAQVGPRVEALALVIGSLIKKITWLANAVTPEILASSADAAALIIDALSPWQTMINTFEALSDFVARRNIGEKAKALTTVIERLILKITWLANLIGEETLTNSARVADMLIAALSPWKVMIDTVAALSDSATASGIGEKAKALTTVVERLILKITWLANLIGDDVLTNSARVADMLIAALSPWQVMIDTVTALANMEGFADIGPNALLLQQGVVVLIMALAKISSGISEETLLAAAEVGRLLSDVLAPWEAAIKLSDEMRAWRIMPDLVDRFTRFARQWVQIIEDLSIAVSALDTEGLALVAAFGDALGALVSGLSEALDLALAMPAQWVDPPSWDAFTAWVQEAFMTFYNWLNGWGWGGSDRPPVPVFDDGALDLVGHFGEVLGALMGGLKAALDLALALPAEWTEPPSWDTFVTWVQDAFLEFYYWIIGWGDGTTRPPVPAFDDGALDLVGAFGNALGALMGGLKAALDLALALPAEWTEPPSWDAFATWVQDAFLLFSQWVNANFPTPEDPEAPDQFGAITGFGNALGALMGGLSAALTLALALPAEWEIPDSWVPFRDWVTEVFGQFMLWVDTYFPTPEDPEAPDQFGAITGFGDALAALMGGLSAALDLALALPTTWTAPSQEMWDAFFGWVTDVFDAFVTYVEENYPTDPESAPDFAPVQAFGDAMGAVFDGLTSALDLFVDLANWAGPSSTFNTRLQTFLEAVSGAISYISTYVSANINPDDLPALTDFGTALSALVGGLSAALNLFAALADTDPSVYTESTLFEDRVGNLLESIGGTLTAFSEWILGPFGETAWLEDAQTFYDAMESVIGVLSSALAFFADLETSGLPPTPEIQAFVTAITDLFSTVATQLGNLTNPNGAMTLAIAAVEGVISGFPAVMDVYQDAWWTSAGALAGRIPVAMMGKVGQVGDPGSSGTIWGALGHISWTLDQWTPGTTMLASYFDRGVSLAQALVDGMLSLAGTGGAMYNAGYALAQAGLDGFDAGAGLAGAMANAMPDGMIGHGFTMDTTHTWELNISGIGSPTGLDLSTAAVDQIVGSLRDRLMRGG